MDQCIQELSDFRILLSSGTMNPLPTDNGLLTKLVERSIAIEVDHVRHADVFVNLPWRDKVFVKDHLNLVLSSWQEFDVASLLNAPTPASVNGLTHSLKGDITCWPSGSGHHSVFSLSSHSSIIKLTCDLVGIWIRNHPDKKARWFRLRDSISALVSSLLGNSETILPQVERMQEPEDIFADAFGTPRASSAIESVSNALASAISREAAASILIVSANARAIVWSQSGSQQPPPIPGALNKAFCCQVSFLSHCLRQDNKISL